LVHSRHGKEVDWWSFGILTHDMLNLESNTVLVHSRHEKEVDWWSFGILTHDIFNLESNKVLVHSRHGKEVDWWSFGILTHDMLTGAPPFTGKHKNVKYRQSFLFRFIVLILKGIWRH
jgi:serine/threonine protein kinase